jgi:ABC-type bacteriocin/lantibiotic exporter with double-glycine peptidase domain
MSYPCLPLVLTTVVVSWLPPLSLYNSAPIRFDVIKPEGLGFRTPENDGVNCLYVQMRLLGYSKKYSEFRDQFWAEPRNEPGLVTLASLSNFAQKLGLRLVPVKMTVADLANVRSPVIVHFEEHGVESGRFHLYLGMDELDRSVCLVRGERVVCDWMPRDQFRRNWSGYALVPQPAISWMLWVRRCVVICVAGIIIALFMRRHRRQAFIKC